MGESRIQTYNEFWQFYLDEHSKPQTKRFHAWGLVAGITLAILGVIYYGPLAILVAPAAGYIPSWYSHFFIEKNRPAAFKYPIWSFISEWRMSFLYFLGKL